ncbi:MAG: F0F1 ATP synthase subunit gamma [Sphingomonadales bacterium]
MESLESLGARIATTDQIGDIVGTMKALSAVSIRQYERAADALGGYDAVIESGLQAVLQGAAGIGGQDEDSGRQALVIIGSDRGLCGRFNQNIVDHGLKTKLQGENQNQTLIAAVGVRAAARLEFLGHAPAATFALPGSVNGLNQSTQDLLVQLSQWRDRQDVARIDVVFNRRAAGASARPTRRRLLPIAQDYLDELVRRPWPSRGLPMFRMARGQLLSWLLRQYLFVNLYRALVESLASEHASRLAAMQAASRNIEERLSDLNAAYRKKRQESITSELLDIVTGFEAASGKGKYAN